LLGDLEGVLVGVVVDLEIFQAAIKIAPGDVGLLDESLLPALGVADASLGDLAASGVLQDPAGPQAPLADTLFVQFRYPLSC
jgi:hypothetical protein